MPDSYILKVCIIGILDELKTKMVHVFTGGLWTQDDSLITGVAYTNKQIIINNVKVKLALVNIMGHKLFDKLRPTYYRGAAAVIITFEKNDINSFQCVKDWYKELKKYIPQTTPIALIGFVSDSEEVTTAEGQNLAEELSIHYYETKPTDNETIEGIFHNITRKMLEKGS